MALSTKTTSTTCNPVKILEVCRVKPFSNSPTTTTKSEFILPLTFFDTYWFKFPPPQRIYFFQLTDPIPTHEAFHSLILPSLKHSLSLALSHFLPLAGTLTWPPHAKRPFILCSSNDAVLLTVAESTTEHFNNLTTKFRDATESHPCLPELPVSNSAGSILALQITFFPSRGFSVATSIHHAILDGKSIAIFMKAWAHLNKHVSSSLPPDLTPSFDRTAIKAPENLDLEILKSWYEQEWEGKDQNPRSLQLLPVGQVPLGSVRAEYMFSREDIERIRKKVLAELGDKEPMHLSSFVLTYAYALACMIKAKNCRVDEEINFGFTADCRARLDPPLPDTYFGNCVVPVLKSLKVRDMIDENGIPFIAEVLSQLVKGLGKKDEDGLPDGAKEVRIEFKAAESSEKQVIGVAGSPKFKVYEVDFGWGKPEKVEVTSIDRTGAISMGENKDGNGRIEVGLVLKRHEMELFDALFLTGLK